MFSDGVPEIRLGKDSALDSCPVCLAANMKSRNRSDGETRTATEPGQGLSLDFSFAGQHSKNATNPEQMRINDYMGIHGEMCYLLLYDHAAERLDGVCRQSKAPPKAWLKKWLPVKFWPYAFIHFLRIKNSALPRQDSTESAHQKLHGEKDDLGLLRTFGCRLWVNILAWQNRAKYIQDTKKGIFLGYRTNTLKNVVWYDPLTDRVKYGYHV